MINLTSVFMTGFFSKDFILESAYGQFYFTGTVVYVIAIIGAIFTTLYSVKVLYLTFLSKPNGPLSNNKAHESDIYMSIPLIILALFSIFFGFITKDIYIGLGSNFFIDNSIFIHPVNEIIIDTEFAVPILFKLLPLIFTVIFSILGIILSEFFSEFIIKFKLSKSGYLIFGFFNQRFLVEFFYNKYITNIVLNLGGQTTRILDKGSIELIGPFGLENVLITSSKNIVSLSTGIVTNYALYILISFVLYSLFFSFNLFLIINIIVALLIILSFYGDSFAIEDLEYNNMDNNNLKFASIIPTYLILKVLRKLYFSLLLLILNSLLFVFTGTVINLDGDDDDNDDNGKPAGDNQNESKKEKEETERIERENRENEEREIRRRNRQLALDSRLNDILRKNARDTIEALSEEKNKNENENNEVEEESTESEKTNLKQYKDASLNMVHSLIKEMENLKIENQEAKTKLDIKEDISLDDEQVPKKENISTKRTLEDSSSSNYNNESNKKSKED